MAITAKDCHVLTSYYLTAYEKRHGRRPVVNRNIARWGFEGMLHDLTMAEVKDLLDFYMKTTGAHNHSLPWFHNNYEKLAASKRDRDADVAAREKLRAETKRKTEEWRKKIDNNRREVD